MSTHTLTSNRSLQDFTVAEFIAALAAKTPTPGGGSVAALVAALAAAQANMTLQYTLGKPKFAAHESELQALANQLAHAAAMLTDLMEQDRAAYQALSPLLKLPAEARLHDPTFAPALLAALRVPQLVGQTCVAVLRRCISMADKINPLLKTDLAVAAQLAAAAAQASRMNVLANLPLLTDTKEVSQFAAEAAAFAAEAAQLSQQVTATVIKDLPS